MNDALEKLNQIVDKVLAYRPRKKRKASKCERQKNSAATHRKTLDITGDKQTIIDKSLKEI